MEGGQGRSNEVCIWDMLVWNMPVGYQVECLADLWKVLTWDTGEKLSSKNKVLLVLPGKRRKEYQKITELYNFR